MCFTATTGWGSRFQYGLRRSRSEFCRSPSSPKKLVGDVPPIGNAYYPSFAEQHRLAISTPQLSSWSRCAESTEFFRTHGNNLSTPLSTSSHSLPHCLRSLTQSIKAARNTKETGGDNETARH